jgi:hypothetical protein
MNQMEEALRNVGFRPSKNLIMERKAEYLQRKAAKANAPVMSKSQRKRIAIQMNG